MLPLIEDAILVFLKQNSESVYFFFMKFRKRERFPYFPMDLPPVRVRLLKRPLIMLGLSYRGLDGGYKYWYNAGVFLRLGVDLMKKGIRVLFLCIYLGPDLVQYFHILKKCLIIYRYMTLRKINMHLN